MFDLYFRVFNYLKDPLILAFVGGYFLSAVLFLFALVRNVRHIGMYISQHPSKVFGVVSGERRKKNGTYIESYFQFKKRLSLLRLWMGATAIVLVGYLGFLTVSPMVRSYALAAGATSSPYTACPTAGAGVEITGASNENIRIISNITFQADLTNMGTIDCGTKNITVASGVTLTMDSYDDGDTTYSSSDDFGVTLNALSLTVETTGIISGNGQGYIHNAGQGTGTNNNNGGAGAGYGGSGGYDYSYTGAPGVVYGDGNNPVDLGSGGASACSASGTSGGSGGGAFKLVVTQTLSLAGSITSDGGAAGHDYCATWRDGGGGSGGSVYIQTNVLTGAGSITAKGGNGYGSTGGVGGGGRIFVNYTTLDSWSGSFSVAVGTGGAGGATGGTALMQTGTSYIVPTAGAIVWDDAADIPGTITDLTISSGSSLTLGGGTYEATALNLQASGTITVDGTMYVVGEASNGTNGHGHTLTAANLTVTGTITSSSYGYAAVTGPGAGSTANGGGGGGYGGAGGSSNGYGGTGGVTYGSSTVPVDLGSGGGNACSAVNGTGGTGGGAIKIVISGTISLSGTIASNGGTSTHCWTGSNYRDGGGGGGGSILVQTNILTGAGSFSANGGNAYGVTGGNGGGGRISIAYLDKTNYVGALSVAAGTGGLNGAVGTTGYITQPSAPTATIGTENIIKNVSINPTLTGSSFVGDASHLNSDWKVQTSSDCNATDSDPTTVVWYKNDETTNKTSIVLNAANGTFTGALAGQTSLAYYNVNPASYYVCLRYNNGVDSNWSTARSFTTQLNNTNSVTYNWDFNTADDYAISSGKTVVAGGVGKLVDLGAGTYTTTPLSNTKIVPNNAFPVFAANTSLDFDTADEGQFTQQDATNGTDFASGRAEVHTIPVGDYGDGSDGALTVSSANTVVNSYTYLTGNETATDTVIAVNDASSFAATDEILIIQMQDSANGFAGRYEFADISSKDGNNITLVTGLTNTYYSGTFNSTSAEVTQIVRIPQYTTVTVNNGASITATAWNYYKGGIIAFRATGAVTINGSINASSTGFLGGAGGVGGARNGYQGESYKGKGVTSNTAANYGGGGGGYGSNNSAGGGGGGYGSVGSAGTRTNPGAGGGTYGSTSLFLFGSAGGGGGQEAGSGGAGGSGGGIIMIYGNSVTTSGTGFIRSDGSVGGNSTHSWSGGGGGGAGGNIYLCADTVTLTASTVLSQGKTGGTGWGVGGTGGDGKVRIDAVSLTGTTTPSAYQGPSPLTIITYSTASASYVTTSNVNQLNTLTWTQLAGVAVTEATPTNTTIKYLVSFDGRSTWKYWNGSAWTSSSIGDIETNGMSGATVEGLVQANWHATGGFIPGSTTTLDFAMSLKTTDATVTPYVDDISVSYNTSSGVFPSGTLLLGFEQTYGGSNAGSAKYQLSCDGTNWYYHQSGDGTWVKVNIPSSSSDMMTSTVANGYIDTFVDFLGGECVGGLRFRTYLISNGTQAVELDNVALTYFGPSNTPTIDAPSAGAIDQARNVTITSSAYSSNGGSHTSTDWQICADSGCSTVLANAADDTDDLTSITATIGTGKFTAVAGQALEGKSQLGMNTTYYVRVRHTDAYGDSSWSTISSFTTLNTNNAPSTPTNTLPVNEATGQSKTPTLTGDAFSDSDGDNQYAAEWHVYAVDDCNGTPVWDSGVTTLNLTSANVPGGNLGGNVTYLWNTRYQDETATEGGWSSWSSCTSFTTSNAAPTLTEEIPMQNMTEDTPVVNGFDLDNYFHDDDAEQTLLYTIETDPAHVDVALNGDNQVTLTPDSNWAGIETLRFQADDQNGSTVLSNLITINVTNVNDIPNNVITNTVSPLALDTPEGRVTSQQPVISWNAATDDDTTDTAETLHYVLQIDDAGDPGNTYAYRYVTVDGDTSINMSVDIPEGELTPVTLPDEAYYYYTIKAVDNEGANGGWMTHTGAFYLNLTLDPIVTVTKIVGINNADVTSGTNNNGQAAVVGATLTYRFDYSNTGDGVAALFNITDTVPTGTTYVANSLIINGVSKTDAVDADEADISGSSLVYSLGTLATSTSGYVKYQVTINNLNSNNSITNTGRYGYTGSGDPISTGTAENGLTKSTINGTIEDDSLGVGNEVPIENVEVILYTDVDEDGAYSPLTDLLLGTANTDENGVYTFTGLAPQTYGVYVDPTQEALQNHFYNVTEGHVSTTITVATGETSSNNDFDYNQYGSVNGYVYNTTTGSNVGKANISVKLYANSISEENLLSTQDTTAEGTYSFTTLEAGTYLVQVDTSDSDLTGYYNTNSTNPTGSITLSEGETENDHNITFEQYGNINGRVYDVSTINNWGLERIDVNLYRDTISEENLVTTVESGPNGVYAFNNLIVDSYIVQVDESDTELTGYYNVSNSNPVEVSVVSGTTGANNDIQYALYSSIYGHVYNTTSGGNVAFIHITVKLYRDSILPENLVSTADSNWLGEYVFNTLIADDYVINVDETDPDLANYYNTNNTNPESVNIVAGEEDRNHNITYNQYGVITGHIYNTTSGSNVGMNNITVRLYRDTIAAPNLVETVTTNSSGVYTFNNQQADDYFVQVNGDDEDLVNYYNTNSTNPTTLITLSAGETESNHDITYDQYGSISGYVYDITTGSNVGIENITVKLYRDSIAEENLVASTSTNGTGVYTFSDQQADSYLMQVYEADTDLSNYYNTGNSNPATVALVPGATETNHNINYYQKGSISGYVYDITTGSNVGIGNITVSLYRDSVAVENLIASTPTNGGGLYTFTGQVADDYIMQVDSEDTDLTNYYNTGNSNPATVALIPGATETNHNIDYYQKGSISGYVYDVTTGSNVGIANITVSLYRDSIEEGNLITTTATDVNGLYTFTGQVADDYLMQVDITDPELVIYYNTGASNPATVALTPGATEVNHDINYYQYGSITGNIHDTTTGSNVGIGNITVKLYRDSITEENLVTTATTSNVVETLGTYTFSNLTADDYLMQVDENDVDLADYYNTNSTNPVTKAIIPGEDATEQNISYDQYGTITGYVYDTTTGSNVGLGNVTVRLYLNTVLAENLVYTTETNSETGVYLFSDVEAGIYKVQVDEADTDLLIYYNTATSNPATVTLAIGVDEIDHNITFEQYGSISGTIKSTDNRVFSGETVTLIETVGATLISTVLSDGSGLYTFTNVPLGSYTITLVEAGSPNRLGTGYTNYQGSNPQSVTVVDGTNITGKDITYQVNGGGVIMVFGPAPSTPPATPPSDSGDGADSGDSTGDTGTGDVGTGNIGTGDTGTTGDAGDTGAQGNTPAGTSSELAAGGIGTDTAITTPVLGGVIGLDSAGNVVIKYGEEERILGGELVFGNLQRLAAGIGSGTTTTLNGAQNLLGTITGSETLRCTPEDIARGKKCIGDTITNSVSGAIKTLSGIDNEKPCITEDTLKLAVNNLPTNSVETVKNTDIAGGSLVKFLLAVSQLDNIPDDLKQYLEAPKTVEEQTELYNQLNTALSKQTYFLAMKDSGENEAISKGNLEISNFSGNGIVLRNTLQVEGEGLPAATKVVVNIFSTHQQKETMTDNAGKWQVNIGLDKLEPGDHQILVQASFGNIISNPMKIMSFTLKSGVRLCNIGWTVIGSFGILLVLLISVLYLIYRNKPVPIPGEF